MLLYLSCNIVITLLICMQMVIKKVLNNLNITCDEAENGQISVDLHKEGKQYDLILMDKEMPVMDGHEVSRLFLFVQML